MSLVRLHLLVFAVVILSVCAPAQSLISGPTREAVTKVLPITPVYQETAEWCWLAVGEMVLSEHFDYPAVNQFGDFQCGVNALYWGPRTSCWSNCRSCPGPARNTQEFEVMLRNYPVAEGRLVNKSALPLRYARTTSLDWGEVQSEINAKRPIVTGINLSGGPRIPGLATHVALIVGYEEDTNQSQWLIVNDPFPYERFGGSPYPVADPFSELLQPGQYKIRYERFKSALGWTYTGYKISDPNDAATTEVPNTNPGFVNTAGDSVLVGGVIADEEAEQYLDYDADFSWDSRPSHPYCVYAITVKNTGKRNQHVSIITHIDLKDRSSKEVVRKRWSVKQKTIKLRPGQIKIVNDKIRWYADDDVMPAFDYDVSGSFE